MVPMVPPAPARFSTTTGVPQRAVRCWAQSRPMMSVVPPGAAGTMIRVVWPGRQDCARAAAGTSSGRASAAGG